MRSTVPCSILPTMTRAEGPGATSVEARDARGAPSVQLDVDLVVCDLDGVVYRGAEACSGAVEGLASFRAAGVAVLFLTNNAGHTRDGIADRLGALGVAARPDEVLTSSWITARLLAQRLADDGASRTANAAGHVLAVGGPGVAASLREVGIEPLDAAGAAARSGEVGEPISVVVQGYGQDIGTLDLNEATYAVAAGATWIATNSDATLPTERGAAPGNGSYLALISHATGRTPDLIVGKPHPAAYDLILAMTGLDPSRILAVGDRLDTDIDGAIAAGMRTALVLTGVDSEATVRQRPIADRPEFVVPTLADLSISSRSES